MGRTRATIAVGDVHGRADLLGDLLDLLADEHRGADVVLLGDYVDRGPDSAMVVETILTGHRGLRLLPLMGNHEVLFLESLRAPDTPRAGAWARHLGGYATLTSYGWSSETPYNFSMIPKAHLSFLSDLPLTHDDGECFYVHAGVAPGISLDRQRARDLLWIRKPFLESNEDFGRLIVHGHTPVADGPDVRANRVNLDVDAWNTGVLAAAVFVPGRRTPEIIRVGAESFPEPERPKWR